MSTKKWIIVTSINHPADAVRKLSLLAPDWTVLVVGDKKTPKGWHCEGVTFLSAEEQLDLGFRLGREAPFNHYARKNLGYLYAIKEGAGLILETDDDNLPYDWYPGDVSRNIRGRLIQKKGWENVYSHFSRSRIWPRGFPLELINESLREKSQANAKEDHACDIQQFLANDNPDVDAVFRLTNEGLETFEGEDVVIGPGSWCPFNSQNTLWHTAAFPYLYLPFTASFRMTDIWRSFVAQHCLYARGGRIAFRAASMYQQRNEHNLLHDFADEVSGYLHNASIMEMLSGLSLEGPDAGESVRKCYSAMVAGGYLNSNENVLFDCWLEDYNRAVDGTRNLCNVPAKSVN